MVPLPRVMAPCPKGVKGIVLITAGFKETEDPRNLLAAAAKYKGKKPVVSCFLSPPGIWDLE